MANPRISTTSTTTSISKTVRVDMIADATAHVIDSLGSLMQIPIDYRVGKGSLAQEGEIWTVVRDPGSGVWTFYACLQAVLPRVAGDVPVGSASDLMLKAMSAAGLVDDQASRVVDWSPWMRVEP